MAAKATIYKANINLSDTDRHYYDDLSLTIALHPSETHERMMARVLVYCFRARHGLSFTRGLSSTDEPELWVKSDDGRILEWIELGQPALERLKKGCSQAEAVKLFTYGKSLGIWWRGLGAEILALPKVQVQYFDTLQLQALTALVQKTMNLTVYISDSVAYVSTDDTSVSVALRDMPAPGEQR